MIEHVCPANQEGHSNWHRPDSTFVQGSLFAVCRYCTCPIKRAHRHSTWWSRVDPVESSDV